MKIPKRITPDRIKDAIVEFRINYNTQYEIFFGLLFNSINKSDEYKYIEQPNSIPLLDNSWTGSRYLFYNDRIKFHINKEEVTINCYDGYIKWSNYQNEIDKILSLIGSLNITSNISRIGMRYVSEYEEVNLSEITKFKFTFGFPNINSSNYFFNSEFNFNGLVVLLNLRNLAPSIIEDKKKNISFIDIDIINDGLDISLIDKETLFPILNKMHDVENQIFFGMLEEDFLKSLNPEY